jgi:hypothetical protein
MLFSLQSWRIIAAMATWLLGKAVSPFLALLFVWLITAPIRRRVERDIPGGRFKRFLLMDRDQRPWQFGAWLFGMYAAVLVAIAVLLRG